MASDKLPEPPAQLKAIQSFMKVASDIERVDPIVAYWLRLHSTETALKIDRDSPECKTFLGAIIVWLEKFKQTHKENESVSNQTVGQAHYENFVLSLFTKVDTLDRNGTANKTTVTMFYMAAVLFEAMVVFGPLTDEISKQAKYAKFKAAYIQKCLKTGQTPKPGPVEGSDLEEIGNSQTPSDKTEPDKSVPSETSVPPNVDKQPQAPDPFILSPSPAPVFPPSRPSTQPETPNKPAIPTQPPKFSPGPSPANSSCNISSNQSGPSSIGAGRLQAIDGTPIGHEDIIKTQKYCKFANSALQYDDIRTAVENLEKALKVLKTGQDSD